MTQELKDKIMALDFECLKFKLIKEKNWSLQKADHVEFLYKAYLYIKTKKLEFSIVPNEDVDEFWHTHILDTLKYHEECQLIFGEYLHHYPYVGYLNNSITVLEENFAKTNEIYMKEFGLDPTLAYEENQDSN